MAIPLSSVDASGMEILARRIRRELELKTQTMGHCAIYGDQLQRIWPLDEENRKGKIEQFAKEHGFKLIFYKLDCAPCLKKNRSANVECKKLFTIP
jgi:hypothetical protein